MKRIIEASSNPGDLVLDPFCGCGTTVYAAGRLGRRWVGIDISSFAIDLIREVRLRDRTVPHLRYPIRPPAPCNGSRRWHAPTTRTSNPTLSTAGTDRGAGFDHECNPIHPLHFDNE